MTAFVSVIIISTGAPKGKITTPQRILFRSVLLATEFLIGFLKMNLVLYVWIICVFVRWEH